MRMTTRVLAVAVLCLLSACAELHPRGAGREFALKGDILYRNGNYAGALVEYERYLETPGGEFLDEALFRVGIISVFYDKKPGSSARARKAFTDLVEGFPDSPRRPEAEGLLEILGRIKELEGENLKLRTDLQKMLDLDIQLEEKRKALQ